MNADPVNCYDYPQYWDMAFRDETRREADFIEAACRLYCPFRCSRLLEPGCGGGRLVVEMAKRGYRMSAYDLSESAVRYVRRRLKRRGLNADTFVEDMVRFRSTRPLDAAFNTMNTFRHLTSESDAVRHLNHVASSLREGGIYILGFHLLPPDASLEDAERWTAHHGSTKVTMSLRVLDASRRRRLETIRFSLRVRSGNKDLRLSSDYRMRMYTAAQFRSTLNRVPGFVLRDVFDFWYDLEDPLELSDELGDAVFILQKQG